MASSQYNPYYNPFNYAQQPPQSPPGGIDSALQQAQYPQPPSHPHHAVAPGPTHTVGHPDQTVDQVPQHEHQQQEQEQQDEQGEQHETISDDAESDPDDVTAPAPDPDPSLLQTPTQNDGRPPSDPGPTPASAPSITKNGKPKGRPKGSKTRLRAKSPVGPVPPRPAPGPLHRGPYRTMDDAIFALQQYCFNNGYGVSQLRNVKEKLSSGKYDPVGDVIRKDMVCDRGGRAFESKGTGRRKRDSIKTGCLWAASVRRLKREGDMWFIEISKPEHNHEPMPHHKMDSLASYRRWQKENNKGMRSAINRLTRVAAMNPVDIANYLNGHHPNAELDKIDRHILRALSVSDTDQLDPSDAASQAPTAFDIIGRRPCIILRDAGTANEQENAQLMALQRQAQELQQQALNLQQQAEQLQKQSG